MRLRLLCWTVPLLLALPRPGFAQEREVARERFTFLATDLTIEVLVETPGTLRIVRGRPGQLDVAARAYDGIAGFGLAGIEQDELQLTAVGASRVEYLVVVPDEVYVRVRLPDRHVSEVFGTMDETGTYTWEDAPG